MDALSGLDPKYIDEAAFELHSVPAGTKKVHRFRMNRGLIIAMPIAAAVLLMVTVALPALIRMGGHSSSTAPASDSAAYESEMGDAAYEADSAAETVEPEAPEYSEEETSEAPMESAEPAYPVAADSAKTESSSEAAINESVNEAAQDMDETAAAIYDNGILLINVDPGLPEDITGITYSVTGTDQTGTVTTFSEGLLSDIMTERDPLTLDISGLVLPNGTYTLTIDGYDIEFTR